MATEASTLPSPVVRQINKQFLICSICLDRYNNPKVLPCLHTFCERYFISDIQLYCLAICFCMTAKSKLQTFIFSILSSVKVILLIRRLYLN